MSTQNRYYSNLSQASSITQTGGLTPSTNAMVVQASTNWPTSLPFIARVEPGTLNEEVVLVTSGAGTAGSPYVITRGYDGTNQVGHSQGSSVVPGFCQLDFAEPQQHLNLTGSASGAHGLPASAWGGGSLQLINTYTLTSGAAVQNLPAIPQTYHTLRIVFQIKSNGTAAGSVEPYADILALQINGVTTATYTSTSFYNDFANAKTAASVHDVYASCGVVWNNFFTTAGRGVGWIEFPGYSRTDFVKGYTSYSTASDGGAASIVQATCSGAIGGVTNTSAISSVQLTTVGSSTGWSAGTVWLYGIN